MESFPVWVINIVMVSIYVSKSFLQRSSQERFSFAWGRLYFYAYLCFVVAKQVFYNRTAQTNRPDLGHTSLNTPRPRAHRKDSMPKPLQPHCSWIPNFCRGKWRVSNGLKHYGYLGPAARGPCLPPVFLAKEADSRFVLFCFPSRKVRSLEMWENNSLTPFPTLTNYFLASDILSLVIYSFGSRLCSYGKIYFLFFFAVLGFELGAYTLNYSASPFLCWLFSR
jgi:hypothetical protein